MKKGPRKDCGFVSPVGYNERWYTANSKAKLEGQRLILRIISQPEPSRRQNDGTLKQSTERSIQWWIEVKSWNNANRPFRKLAHIKGAYTYWVFDVAVSVILGTLRSDNGDVHENVTEK